MPKPKKATIIDAKKVPKNDSHIDTTTREEVTSLNASRLSANEETVILVFESDDDFVNPNPVIKAKRKKLAANKSSLFEKSDICNNISLEGRNLSERFDDTGISLSSFKNCTTDSEKTHPNSMQSTASSSSVSITPWNNSVRESDHDVIILDDEHESFTQTQLNTSSSLKPHNQSNSSSTHNEWKSLMQQMQTSQVELKKSSVGGHHFSKSSRKTNKSKASTVYSKGHGATTRSKKNRTNYSQSQLSLSGSILATSPQKTANLSQDDTQLLFVSQSPPNKKPKFQNISHFTVSDAAMADVSNVVQNSVSADDKISKRKPKLAPIFLSKAEKEAEAKALLDQEEKVLDQFSDALKHLSVEPTLYKSVNPVLFDGNVVKLNENLDESPPATSGLPDISSSGRQRRGKLCPFYKRIPGTTFTVDAFSYGEIPGVEVYFLSHFHSDHYVGLTKRFSKTIICSPPTGNLVRQKLYVNEECIRRLQLNTPYIVAGAEVVLLNANHCPGSVMFIFRLKNGVTYLHTGDFRFSPEMLSSPFIEGVKFESIYLDTTYCDPKYDFPTQESAILKLIMAVKNVLERNPKSLILCGSYLIGKERVYFSLAEALNKKVYLTTDKKKIIAALENPTYSKYLANNEYSGDIHVVQMNQLNQQFLKKYLDDKSQTYKHIIGIKPSGWQFSSSGSHQVTVKTLLNGSATFIGVPYSEHSSFSELRTFVSSIESLNVQPTVNYESTSKRNLMLNHIKDWLNHS